MPPRAKHLVFFPTYNEAGNVTSLLAGISQAAPAADILIVDDNSTDGTADIARGCNSAGLQCLVRPRKLGIGSAHLLAWQYAQHHGYDVLVTMDGDQSHDAAEIPALLAKIDGGCDLVAGSRYTVGGRCDYTGYRNWVSRAANVAARILLQIPLAEFTTSFRAFRVGRLAAIDAGDLLVSGYSYFFMTVVLAHISGFQIAEVPIHFHARAAGRSKIPPFEILRGVQNLLRCVPLRYGGKPISRNPATRTGCNACGCAYSRIIVHPPGAAGRTQNARELCLFCGDAA